MIIVKATSLHLAGFSAKFPCSLPFVYSSMSMLYVQVAVMEAGPLGELMTEAGDSLVTSPVAEVGHAIAKELAPVSKTFQSAAASAKVIMDTNVLIKL